MNNISSDDQPPRGALGLDPDLLRLFDEAPAVLHDDAFVVTVLARLRRARRARLLVRAILTAAIVVLGGFLAPYVAQATLTVMASFAIYPAACACAALLAWRIARRRFN